MKQLITIIILFCLSKYNYSQDTISEKLKKQYLIENKLIIAPSKIIKYFTIAEPWLKSDDPFSEPEPFESAYYLNVWDYFKLNEKYNSDLKKDVFKQSKEYNNLLDSLKKIKLTYLNTVYYQTDFNQVGGETFEMVDSEEIMNLVYYDLVKKGFFISIGKVLPFQCCKSFCPKVIENVEFKQLPITKKHNVTNSRNSYSQYLFIPLDATTALEIENNRSHVKILRVYNIIDIHTSVFDDADFRADNIDEKLCKIRLVKGGNMRLIIFNDLTDNVYYDFIYKALK